MGDVINFVDAGIALRDVIIVISLIIAIVRIIEGLFVWIGKKLTSYYKRRRGIEEKDNTIDKHTQEIQTLAERIDKLFDVVTTKYDTLLAKIDDQQEHLEQIDEDGKRRDCAVLRDRILGGMRYFSQNKDEHGRVHISLTDHENMEEMFTEYFGCKGNGSVKHIYETEFAHFIIFCALGMFVLSRTTVLPNVQAMDFHLTLAFVKKSDIMAFDKEGEYRGKKKI